MMHFIRGKPVPIEPANTTAPPALRARRPKHAAPSHLSTKRLAGGAMLSAALAGGTLFGLATGTAEAAPCWGSSCNTPGIGDPLFVNALATPSAKVAIPNSLDGGG